MFEKYALFIDKCISHRTCAVALVDISLDDLKDLANDLWTIHDNFSEDNQSLGMWEEVLVRISHFVLLDITEWHLSSALQSKTLTLSSPSGVFIIQWLVSGDFLLSTITSGLTLWRGIGQTVVFYSMQTSIQIPTTARILGSAILNQMIRDVRRWRFRIWTMIAVYDTFTSHSRHGG